MTTPTQLAQLEFKKDLEKVIIELQTMLIAKNVQYGDSALNPVQVFSRSSALELIRVRIDDKLARIRNGDTSEDASWDLMGYLVLERIAMNRVGASAPPYNPGMHAPSTPKMVFSTPQPPPCPSYQYPVGGSPF